MAVALSELGSSAHPNLYEVETKIKMTDDTGAETQVVPLQKLQEHLNKYGARRKQAGVKLQSGQAEKLICDLESTASSENNECLTIAAMTEQDTKLANQASTQVLHTGAEAARQTHTSKRDPRATVQKIKNVQDSRTRPTMDSKHNRDERIKKMEGPAESANELAKKLSYFTYYELLYLDDDATTEDIHTAYLKRTTAIRSRFRSGVQEWRLNEFLRALHEAHSVLTNDKLRKEYDARLAAGQWNGTFQDLVAQVPDFAEGGNWSGNAGESISLTDLLICAGFVTPSELAEFHSTKSVQGAVPKDGPDLAQALADAGLISFEELASVLLGKALIDRRQITIDQFKHAVSDMREHSHKLVDTLVSQGWLTPSELNLIGLD
jgi:hypothetical protein